MERKRWSFPLELNKALLHILAMALMLSDHMWATITPGHEWMHSVGRIAYPIFAFMVAEGFFLTHNRKKYILRMLVFALLSEVPFDWMYGASAFYPYHQNVLWTFLIALLGMLIIEKVKEKEKLWLTILTGGLTLASCSLLSLATMTDYYAAGVVTVFIFYFFNQRKWWCFLGQFLAMYWLNVEVLAGRVFPFEIFGMKFELVQQGLALVALLPIWLYRGKQGWHSKGFQYFCYAFYPVHILILMIIYNLTL